MTAHFFLAFPKILLKQLSYIAFFLSLASSVHAGIFDDIKKVGQDIGEAVADTGKEAVNAVGNTGETAGKAIVNTGEQAGEAIVDTGETIGHGVVHAGETVGQGIVEVGEHTGQVMQNTAEIVGSEIVRTSEQALHQAIALGEKVMIEMGTNAIVPRTNGLSADKRNRLRLQHRLDYDVALSDATWIGSHNSYNNRDAKYPLPNQNADMIEQLDNGFRVLSYDLYADKITSGTPVRLCHKLCSGQEDTFDAGLNALAYWLSQNPSEVVLIIIEYDLSSSDANEAANTIAQYLGNSVYAPAHHFANNNGACQKLPINHLTKRAVLDAGKQVILTSYEGCNNQGQWRNYVWDLPNKGYMADAALRENDLRSKTQLNVVAEDRSVYGADLFCADYLNIKEIRAIAGLAGKLGIPGANSSDIQRAFDQCKDRLELTAEEIYEALVKGIAVVGLDYAVDIDRAEGAIWSWEQQQPDGGAAENCAAIANESGRYRWYDVSCDSAAHVACLDVSTQKWQVPETQTSYQNGEALCQSLGTNYHFAAPVNGKEHYQLSRVANGVTLINATDATNEGDWRLNFIKVMSTNTGQAVDTEASSNQQAQLVEQEEYDQVQVEQEEGQEEELEEYYDEQESFDQEEAYDTYDEE